MLPVPEPPKNELEEPITEFMAGDLEAFEPPNIAEEAGCEDPAPNIPPVGVPSLLPSLLPPVLLAAG